jgi:hypothetical protein
MAPKKDFSSGPLDFRKAHEKALSSVGSSPDFGRGGSRAAQRVASPELYLGGPQPWPIPTPGENELGTRICSPHRPAGLRSN